MSSSNFFISFTCPLPKNTMESLREWVVEHKLRAVGCLWLSGLAGSIAYNWTQPNMKTSVRIIHARYHTLSRIQGSEFALTKNMSESNILKLSSSVLDTTIMSHGGKLFECNICKRGELSDSIRILEYWVGFIDSKAKNTTQASAAR